MVVNWLEIGLQTAFMLIILLGVALYVKYRGGPKLKAQAGEWAGAAIGRFWETLMKKSEAEGGGGTAGTGKVKLGGFEIDVGTIKELVSIVPQLMQVASMLGLVKGGGGENPFL